MITNNRRFEIVADFTPGHTYEIIIAARDSIGRQQNEEDSPKKQITIRGKIAAPAGISDATAAADFINIHLSWTNPTNLDFSYVEIWRATNNSFSASPGGASLVGVSSGDSFSDYIGSTGLTRYYWLRAVNTSGNKSAFVPPGETTTIFATTEGIPSSGIDDFAVTATKMFNNTIILNADSWTNNSPGAGSIAWNAHSIVYGGASYPINAGNTSLAYVYWTIGNTTYSTSATHPTLGTTAFMIAINTGGTHTLVWNDSANMVIGSAFIANLLVDKLTANAASTNEFVSNTAQIKNAIITNAKINDLSVGKLTSGAIISKTITLSSSGADCYINAGKSQWDNTQTGFILGLDGATPKFYIGDTTYHMSWDGSISEVQGTIQTAASGKRVVIDGPNNNMKFYNATALVLTLDDDLGAAAGNRPGIEIFDGSGQGIFIAGDIDTGTDYALMLEGRVGVVSTSALLFDGWYRGAGANDVLRLLAGVAAPSEILAVNNAGLVDAAGGYADAGNSGIDDAILSASGETFIVGGGIVTAVAADLKMKFTALGGLAIKLTNKTGANTVAGQLISFDTTTDDAVALTTADDDECSGVFLDSGVANNAEAWVVIAGVADVAMQDNTAATHGNWVRTSIIEAGYANATNAGPPGGGIPELDRHMKEIGNCIESVSATGGGTHILARCVLHFN